MAESIVEGMLSKRYALPLSFIPGNLSAITADLAAGAIIGEIVGNKGENGEPTQSVYLRKNAMEILQMIEDGRILLSIEGITSSSGAQARCSTYYHRSKFARWDPARPETYRDRRRR